MTEREEFIAECCGVLVVILAVIGTASYVISQLI